jgi:hypothetical protein
VCILFEHGHALCATPGINLTFQHSDSKTALVVSPLAAAALTDPWRGPPELWPLNVLPRRFLLLLLLPPLLLLQLQADLPLVLPPSTGNPFAAWPGGWPW